MCSMCVYGRVDYVRKGIAYSTIGIETKKFPITLLRVLPYDEAYKRGNKTR